MSKNPQISGILGQLGSQYEQAVRRGSGRTVEGASESATVIIKYMEEYLKHITLDYQKECVRKFKLNLVKKKLKLWSLLLLLEWELTKKMLAW